MLPTNRIVVIAVALTVVATLYSLSELHRISAEHTAQDKRASFGSHEDSALTGEGASTQGDADERSSHGDAYDCE